MANNPSDRDQGNYSQQNKAGSGSRDQADGARGKDQAGRQAGQQSSGRDQSREQHRAGQGEFGSSNKQMSGSSGSDINLRLTPEQQAQIRQATGKNLQSLSLSVEDLNQGSSQGSRSETETESDSSMDEREIEE